jgi:hypothetical protein
MLRFWLALLAVVVPLRSGVAADLTPPRLLPEFDLGAIGWSEPSIAFDGTRYLVVWENGGSVHGAFVSAAGAVLGSSFPIVGDARNPAVASDGTNFLVAWEDSVPLRPARLYAMLLGPDGAPLSAAPTRVYGDPESGRFHPRIVFDGTDFFVVWSNLAQWGDVYCSSLARATAALNGPVLVVGGTGLNEMPANEVMPDVAFDGQTFLVVWQRRHVGPGGTDDGTHGSFVTRSPLLVGDHAQIIPDVANVQYPSVAFDGTNYLVASGGVGVRLAPDGTIIDPAGLDLPDVSRLGFDGSSFVAIKALASGTHGVLVGPDGTSGPEFSLSDLPGGQGGQRRPDVSAQHGHALVVYQVYDPATATWSLRGRLLVAQKTLLVSRSGTGQGTVSGPGITCGTGCTRTYDVGSAVTLVASPAPDSVFTGWSGACAGTGPCTVTLADAAQVTARFDLARVTYALRLTRSGDGSGAVFSTPPGIECRGACSVRVAANRVVTLSAAPDAHSVFKTWGVTCAGTAPCRFRMDSDKTVDARFALASYPVSVILAGKGSGRVVATGASGARLECRTGTCTNPFLNGEAVELVATPDASSLFTGWTGNGCRGTSRACRLIVAGPINATATFQPSILP